MKLAFPHLHFSKRQQRRKQDEETFAQASALALLRLQQCKADLQEPHPSLKDSPQLQRVGAR